MEFVQPIRDRKKIEAMKKILASNPRNLLLFVLGINSALRVSDLLNLRVRDVVDENGKTREFLEVREKKTGKTKQFELSKNALKALRLYLAAVNPKPAHYLFRSREGRNRPLSRQQVHKILSDSAETVGIRERVGTHSLRKTFGYHAHQAGVSISLLQWLLNHSSQATTMRYLGLTQDDANQVIRDLNL
jgi:integrase